MKGHVDDVRRWVEDRDAKLFRSVPFEIEELRDSGNGIPGSYAIKGTAAVYNQWSLNLGGFRERILPGAFDRVLSEDPHVLHTWDHDTARALSSTRSKTFPLELKSMKKTGLGFYSRVAPTTDAANLRILMEGDVIDQSSFAFTTREAEWRYLEEEDILERDIVEVEGLFDVTTCAMGAYPQTDSEIAVRSLMQGREPVAVFFGDRTLAESFVTRGSGGDGNAEPEGDPAPSEGTPDADPADPETGGGDAEATDQPEAQPEDREAKEREFRLWQKKVAADYRRTREFAHGVTSSKE